MATILELTTHSQNNSFTLSLCCFNHPLKDFELGELAKSTKEDSDFENKQRSFRTERTLVGFLALCRRYLLDKQFSNYLFLSSIFLNFANDTYTDECVEKSVRGKPNRRALAIYRLSH